MLKLVIPGRLPGLNEYIDANRSSRYLGAKMKKAAEEKICWHIQEQIGKVKMIRSARVRLEWIEKDNKRDPDNVAFAKKFILDALVRMKVLENDNSNVILGFEDHYRIDRNHPRIEVYIEEVIE